MAYARISDDSEVHVIRSRPGDLACFCAEACAVCQIVTRGSFHTASRLAMVEHLLDHRVRGDRVPERALERLYREIEGLGDDA